MRPSGPDRVESNEHPWPIHVAAAGITWAAAALVFVEGTRACVGFFKEYGVELPRVTLELINAHRALNPWSFEPSGRMVVRAALPLIVVCGLPLVAQAGRRRRAAAVALTGAAVILACATLAWLNPSLARLYTFSATAAWAGLVGYGGAMLARRGRPAAIGITVGGLLALLVQLLALGVPLLRAIDALQRSGV